MISDEMKQECRAEARSGASVKSLADKHGVSTKSIYNWIRPKKGGGKKSASRTKKPAGFIEFRATLTHLEARLELKNGTKVYVPISALKETLAILGERS